MDAHRRITGNQKGFAGVYMAILILVVVGFVSLGVDLGYMYFARGQLQNASDAAALAGAAKLDGTNSTSQPTARSSAVTFAVANQTVPESTDSRVQIASDGTNELDAGNDITVGNWNSTLNPKYEAGRTPINAVRVRARRTADSPGEKVGLFFGNAFGWPTMNASADAIAAKTARATANFAICTAACGSITGVRELQTGPSVAYENAFAWSSLLVKPSAPGFNLNELICRSVPNEEICNEQIYTTMGTATVTLRNLESVMYDPLLDTANKEKDASGNVIGWWVTVPVADTCPPGAQGIGNEIDPKGVWGYARIHIQAVCATGGGNPCGNGYNASQDECRAYSNNVMVIDQIQCTSCANAAGLQWLKPTLKK